MTKKVSLSLRTGTLRKVKREAVRQRRSVSSMVNIWLESYAKDGNGTGEKGAAAT